MCAVHGLWEKFWDGKDEGHQPWLDISPSYARQKLRDLLQRFDVPNAQKYGTQVLRHKSTQ